MSQPTSKFQIQFLKKLQRLLAEGRFTASYKYALLLALADVAVEHGDDSGNPDHHVRRWTFPGPCPKCGIDMVEGNLVEDWD